MRSVAFHPEAQAEFIAAASITSLKRRTWGSTSFLQSRRHIAGSSPCRTAVAPSHLGSGAFCCQASHTVSSIGLRQIAYSSSPSLTFADGPAIGVRGPEERAAQQAAEADVRGLQPIALLLPDTMHGRIIGGRSLAAIR